MNGKRMFWRGAATALAACGAIGFWSCALPGHGTGAAGAPHAAPANAGEWVFEDFERPDPPVSWVPADASPSKQNPSADTGPPPGTTNPDGAPQTQPDSPPAAKSKSAKGPPSAGAAIGDQSTPHRTALKPKSGLWALGESVNGPGTLAYKPKRPLDFSRFDQILIPVCHTDPPERNGDLAAAATVIDAAGNRFTGDAFAVLSTWEPLLVDLGRAKAAGVDLAHVVEIQIALAHPGPPQPGGPLDLETDAWSARAGMKTYVGQRQGKLRTFYVQSGGGHIRIGTVGQYEMVFSDRGAAAQIPADSASAPATASAKTGARGSATGALRMGAPAGPVPPWLDIFTALKPPEESTALASVSLQKVLGQPDSGLMLLDQAGIDDLGAARRKDADGASAGGGELASPSPAVMPKIPSAWPADALPGAAALVRSHWDVAWSSPVAAMVEGQEEYGPYDRLGEPAVVLDWRFMIYQWGQAFVHVRWNKSGESAAAVSVPITWALAADPASWADEENTGGALQTGSAAAEERLLADVYTAPFREGLETALPHRMQSGFPVALISGDGSQKDVFWRANAVAATDPLARRRIFGAGFSTPAGAASGEANCMLLVNNPNALTKAGTFSGYLSPPKLVMRQGELDVTVPGDMNNDGFVEAYGFQAIRLAGGRAAFTIYPQNRPIFYPVFLFTVPAIDRKSLDVAHSRLLVNVDGRQFADPPVFPDGSFLLQIPYVLDRPVTVEAELVKH